MVPRLEAFAHQPSIKNQPIGVRNARITQFRPTGPGDVELTVSIGLGVSNPGDPGSGKALIATARQALLQAGLRGPNELEIRDAAGPA